MGPREFEITPEGWLPRGEAVVHGRRKQLVLWNAIPGEPAVAHLYHEGQTQDLARVLRPANKPHPLRREPPCDRFHVCGGCPLMHLVPEGQSRVRVHLVREALAEHGLAEHAPAEIVPSPDGDRDFRYVLKLAVGLSDQGHLRVGTFGRASRSVVPIPECLVTTNTLREGMMVLAHHVRELKLFPYDPEHDRGLLRSVLLRQSRLTGEVLVTVIAARKLPLLWDFAERISSGLSAVVGVHLHLNDGPGNQVFLRDAQGLGDTTRLSGKETLEEGQDGLRLRVGPSDLYSTNPGMNERVVKDVVELLDDHPQSPALDLYCGVGGTTLALARAHGFGVGVEVLPGAVDRARENAAHNKIGAEFASGAMADVLPEVARRLGGTAPVVHVDTARLGLEPAVFEGVTALEPAALVLRSANPRLLAKDLAEFRARGWRVDAVRAYEMHPQTPHVELLARLSPSVTPEPARRPPRRKVVRA